HWFILLMLGVFGATGHWLLVQAYRLATTTALAPYPYSQMVWMIISGWIIFNQFPDRWTLLGAAIIVASGLYIIHREHRLRLRNSATLDAEAEALAKKL
ncbi:MAG: DMT family transporter, partial [Mesorhizobium sp.]